MGRGRAKAKQTKVARELKYRTYEPDLGALQRELAGQDDGDGNGRERRDSDSADQDHADYVDPYDDGSGLEDDSRGPGRR